MLLDCSCCCKLDADSEVWRPRRSTKDSFCFSVVLVSPKPSDVSLMSNRRSTTWFSGSALATVVAVVAVVSTGVSHDLRSIRDLELFSGSTCCC